jgi:hypothetical protein
MFLGLALSAVGTVASVIGGMGEANAMKKAEDLREKQMNLDTLRQNRQIVRNSIMARSQATATAAAQGGGYGSALPGAYGTIAGQTNSQLEASDQNNEIGRGIFAANRSYYNSSMISDFGAGMSSLGGMFMNQAGQIERVGQVGYF